MSRRADRRHAFTLVYQIDFSEKDELKDRVECYLDEEEIVDSSKEYVLRAFWGVVEKLDEIDELIDENAKGWTISRMNKVDVAIMRLALYELLFMEDIPQNVSLNEAVELAKRYSSDDAPPFINGVLGGVENSRI